MKRTKLDDRVLPSYTKGEEIFNMVTHICGAALGVVAIVLLAIFSAIHHNVYGIISGVIFGVSMIVLYTMSSIYHGLSPKLKQKKFSNIWSLCDIFIDSRILHSFCLCTLRSYDTSTGWIIFGVIWLTAIIGILLNSIDIKKYKVLSMICYLLMGWCIIVRGNILPELLTNLGFALLLAGGIIYSIGAVLYGLGKKRKYVHSIFHIFIFLGNLLHFFCILFS